MIKKGKRLLSLLLAVVMLVGVFPTSVFAAAVGEPVKNTTGEEPEPIEGFFWKNTGTSEAVDPEKCHFPDSEHVHSADCYGYLQICDHKKGHLSTCYPTEYVYEKCPGSSHDHTQEINVGDVVKRDSIFNITWDQSHPAYSVVKAYYDSLTGFNNKLSIFTTEFCYTATEGEEPTKCSHGECTTDNCYISYLSCSQHVHDEDC
ncbi:MAG: hypothetical protein IJ484_01310, partial [Oscillospiraceae bacterium]|nr:hypothetical protein [Oscillospiraceae bacterium]